MTVVEDSPDTREDIPEPGHWDTDTAVRAFTPAHNQNGDPVALFYTERCGVLFSPSPIPGVPRIEVSREQASTISVVRPHRAVRGG